MAETGESTISVPIPAKPNFSLFSKRLIVALLLLALLVFILAGAWYFGKKAPPRVARLLPESDAIVYFDVAPLRAATHFDRRSVTYDPDYQRFINATGIQVEQDLSEVAFALHRMDNPLGPNGPVAYSSIFMGKFDRQRLSTYLEGIAQSKEHYAGHDIYLVPIEGRTDRVVILDAKTVAVSNTPSGEQIHSILDRHRTAFLPLSSNTLLAQRYGEVPLFSLAWGIGKLAIGLGSDFDVLGFKLPLSVDTTFIASLRWVGALRLKVEEIAPNGTAAMLSADSLGGLLNIVKTAENALPNGLTDPGAKAFLNSVEIEHHNDRAIVTATVPISLLQKLATSPSSQPASP
jgi:hypothetical protein